MSAPEGTPSGIKAKIDPQLLRRLRGLPRGERISVSIWVRLRSAPTPERGEMREEYLKALRAALNTSRRGVLKALARMRIRATTAALAPVVFARLTRVQIFMIARRSDVRKVYGPDRNTRFSP